MENNQVTFTEQQRKDALATIIAVFIKADPAWKACGKDDTMGVYRFLTGRNSHTMSHLFEELKEEIAIIIAYGEHEIAKARQLQQAA